MLSNNLAVLGSTGSIGIQALRVAKRLGLNIVALSCDRDVKALENQARMTMPDMVAIRDETAYKALKLALADTNIKIIAGVTAQAKLQAMKKPMWLSIRLLVLPV
jgi:1-deoxy-D-xylulose-5-phosphate reductoisomerase